MKIRLRGEEMKKIWRVCGAATSQSQNDKYIRLFKQGKEITAYGVASYHAARLTLEIAADAGDDGAYCLPMINLPKKFMLCDIEFTPTGYPELPKADVAFSFDLGAETMGQSLFYVKKTMSEIERNFPIYEKERRASFQVGQLTQALKAFDASQGLIFTLDETDDDDVRPVMIQTPSGGVSVIVMPYRLARKRGEE